MPNESIPPDTLLTLAALVGYAALMIVVALRRGVRRREPALCVVYLALAAAWFLIIVQTKLRVLLSPILWEGIVAYAPIGLGIVLWDFVRAFLRQPVLPIGGWLSAAVVIAALLALASGVAMLPPFALDLGGVAVTEKMLTPARLGAMAAIIYNSIALLVALVELARQASPLHRNRIKFLIPSIVLFIVGLALVLTRREELVGAGMGVHWLGAALVTYLVVQPQLPDIATAIRRALNYLFAALIPVIVAIGLALGAVYLLSWSPLFRLQLTEDVVIGILLASVIVFVLFQPLNSLTRRVLGRLLFGRGFGAQQIVREYGQAVSQILALDTLATTAMTIIDRALGIQRGALLVVEEARESGWRLRVVEGRGVSANPPALTLKADSPLAKWLIEKGAPLHQYTMDIAPEFESLSPADREEWRRLGMEVFVPVKRSGALIGLLALGVRRSGHSYTDRELEVMTTLADQTAVALENASLFDRIQRRAEQLALLNEIGRAITTSLDLEPAVDLITERIERSFKGSSGFVFLTDESAGDLVLRRSFRREMSAIGACRVPFGKGLVGAVAAAGEPAFVADLARDSRYAPDVEGVLAAGTEAALCAPLVARGKTIGVILIVDAARGNLGMTELWLLDSIAAFASIAIENARQVAAREALLRQEVAQLRIEIDEAKKERQVAEITETDYFQKLHDRAQQLRAGKREEASSDA